jgi:glutamate synthase domain-containing protein 1
MLRIPTRSQYLNFKKLYHSKYISSHRKYYGYNRVPDSVGLYDRNLETDSCGVGIVAHLKRVASRQIVLDANNMLIRLSHRGGCGCEVNTGDGAGRLSHSGFLSHYFGKYHSNADIGILLGMPDQFFRRKVKESLNYDLGPVGSFASGIVFSPPSEDAVDKLKKIFMTHAEASGVKIIGWRTLSTGLIIFLLDFLSI